MVLALPDHFVRHDESQILRRPVKTGEAAFRNGSLVAVDVGDPSVAHLVRIPYQRVDPDHIVRKDRGPVIVRMVDRNDRKVRIGQFHDQRILEVRTDQGDTVYAAVKRVLQITLSLMAHVTVNKRNIISAGL